MLFRILLAPPCPALIPAFPCLQGSAPTAGFRPHSTVGRGTGRTRRGDGREQGGPVEGQGQGMARGGALSDILKLPTMNYLCGPILYTHCSGYRYVWCFPLPTFRIFFSLKFIERVSLKGRPIPAGQRDIIRDQ